MQHFLRSHRRDLAKLGWGYPAFLSRANHTEMALPFSDSFTSSWHRLYGVTDQITADAKIADIRVGLASAPERDRWIVSTEHFTKTVRDPAGMARVIDFFRTYFDEIELLCYVRRQDFMLPSLYSQVIKAGGVDAWDWEYFSGALEKRNYLTMCQDWASAGADTFTIRPFQENYKGAQSSLINDFIMAAGLPTELLQPTEASARGRRTNPGLSAEGTAFLRLVNPLVPRISDGQSNMRRRRNLIDKIGGLTPGASLGLSPELRERVMENVAGTNVSFIEEFGGDCDWQEWLSQEWHEGATPEITPERIVEVMALTSQPSGPMDWGRPTAPPARDEVAQAGVLSRLRGARLLGRGR